MRRVRRRLLLGLGAALWIAGSTLVASAAEMPTELVGDWYVLIHYRDLAGEDPDQVFWDDEIWRIAPRGERLSWALYPHVTLRDDDGRFETLPSGAEQRTARAWSPSPSQLAEIRTGLRLDEHESRIKSLRGSEATGWQTPNAARSHSASLIAYQESWSISGSTRARELVRMAVFEAARTDRAEGRTVFTIRASKEDRAEMSGDYARDGQLVGEFRMFRVSLAQDASR